MAIEVEPSTGSHDHRSKTRPWPRSPRRYLVYCPTQNTDYLGEFFGPERLFDVAFNDWCGEGIGLDQAEYVFTERNHKWPCAKINIPKIPHRYDFYAFIDDDVGITTADLNRLFLAGEALQLELYQAGLGQGSICVYPTLFSQPGSFVRPVRFVEIMMPVFSRAALERCLPAFDESESGWGLDFLWAKLLDFQGMAVVDAVTASHTRPIQSQAWISSDGFTPTQELERIVKVHKLNVKIR